MSLRHPAVLALVMGLLFLPSLSRVAAAADAADARLPVPTEAAQAKAGKLIRELFKDDFAERARAGRLALARKLLKQGGETAAADDAAAKFVLLREARDVAAAAGEVGVAMAAAEEIVATFRVRRAEAKLAALPPAAKAADAAELARALVAVSNDAIAEEDWVSATKAASMAAASAGKLRGDDKAAAARARAQPAVVTRNRKLASAAADAKKKLNADPDDPKANLLLGRYLCFSRGDWAAGAPHLAKGRDPALAALAKGELAPPDDATAMAAHADALWAAADSGANDDAEPIRLRAIHWYRKALPDLTGLGKSLAQQRVGGPAKRPVSYGRVYRISAKEKGVKLGMEDRDVGENFVMEFELRTAKASPPPGGRGIVLSKRHRRDVGESSLTVVVRGDGTLSVASDADGRWVDTEGTARVNDGKWHRVLVEKRGSELTLTVDGNVDAKSEVDSTYTSGSPWMLGWHGGWGHGAFDGEVRILQLGEPGT